MLEIRKWIHEIADERLRKNITERLDLIQHKIKFMEKASVCVLDSLGNPNMLLADFLLQVGGQFTAQPTDGVYLLFFEKNKTLEDLMRCAPALLNTTQRQSIKYNRIYLLADNYAFNKPVEAINLIEDLAEMLHPGHFIFGSEGDKWVRFTI